jgi:hypothetical protein
MRIDNNSKEITVRLTTDRSFLSYLTFFMSFGEHTHVAIGLRDEDEFFYSFNMKGFRKEYLHPRKERKINSTTYKIRVSEESYQALEEKLNSMYANKDDFSYSIAGVMICLFRLPIWLRFKKTFFCSQFVAKTLTETGCIKIKKIPEYCFPGRIAREIKKSGQLVEIQHTNELELIPIQSIVIKNAKRSALWCRLMARRYARRLKKMYIKICFEKYREFLKANKKDNDINQERKYFYDNERNIKSA